MTILNSKTAFEYLSVTDSTGRYRYVFEGDQERLYEGIPSKLNHGLIDTQTGKLIGQEKCYFPEPRRGEDAVKLELVALLKCASARAFFKSIARRPGLWPAWDDLDYEYLRNNGATNYVVFEELVNAYYQTVLNQEYIVQRPSGNGWYCRDVRCTDVFRREFHGVRLSLIRKMRLSKPIKESRFVNVTYEIQPSFSSGLYIDTGDLSIGKRYPLESWPTVKQFIEEPAVAKVVRAWCDSWSEVARQQGLVNTK